VNVDATIINEVLFGLEQIVSRCDIFTIEIMSELRQICRGLHPILCRRIYASVKELLTPKPRMYEGLFITVSGIDKAGKETQCFNPDNLEGVVSIQSLLKGYGYRVYAISLPSYNSLLGALVGAYLGRSDIRHKITIIGRIDDDLAWILWSLDRGQYAGKISNWLKDRKVAILAKRWTESNLAYQAAKGIDPSRILRFERNVPQPSLTLVIDIPVEEVLRRASKPDIYEQNISYLEEVRRMYFKLVESGLIGAAVVVNGLGRPEDVNRRLRAIISRVVGRK
jgi:dTMP kinase